MTGITRQVDQSQGTNNFNTETRCYSGHLRRLSTMKELADNLKVKKALLDACKWLFVERGILRNPKAYQVMVETDRADFLSKWSIRWLPSVNWFQRNNISTSYARFRTWSRSPFHKPRSASKSLGCRQRIWILVRCLCRSFSTPSGKVYGIEHIQLLVNLARRNTEKVNADLLDGYRIYFICEDGRKGFLPGTPLRYNPCRTSSSTFPQDN